MSALRGILQHSEILVSRVPYITAFDRDAHRYTLVFHVWLLLESVLKYMELHYFTAFANHARRTLGVEGAVEPSFEASMSEKGATQSKGSIAAERVVVQVSACHARMDYPR